MTNLFNLFIPLIISIVIIIYLFENMKKLKLDNKRVMVVIACILFIIVVAFANILLNGKCGVGSEKVMPFKDIPQIQCRLECHCDGLKIGESCLGEWRKICKHE